MRLSRGVLYTRVSAMFSKPHVVFFVLALPFSIISVFVTPSLRVADETQHLLRAYTVSSGDVLPNHRQNSRCYVPATIANYVNSYSTNHGQKTPEQLTYLDKKIDYNNLKQHSCGTAGSYPLLMYLPQSIGMLLSRLLDTNLHTLVNLGRLCNAIFYCFALYFIIKWVRLGKWAFVAIGLLPLSIHYAGSLSADPVNNIVLLGFCAFVFNLYIQKATMTRKQILLLLGLTILLGLTKPQNLALLILLPFLPASLFVENRKNLRFRSPNIHKWVIGVCVILLALIIYMLFWMSPAATAGPYQAAASHKFLFHPAFLAHILWDTYLSPFSAFSYGSFVFTGLVGGFSSYAWQLPAAITFLCMFTLALTLMYRNREEKLSNAQPGRSMIIGSLLGLVLLVGLVTYAMYTTWAVLPNHSGLHAVLAEGVQGRYFTASLILLLPVALKFGTHLQIRPKANYTFGCFIFTSFFISLTFYTVSSIQYLRMF